MTIYAKLNDDGVLETMEEEEEGFTAYNVKHVSQVYVKETFKKDTEEPDRVIEILPYQNVKKSILKQIDNVYNYLSEQKDYTEGTKAKYLLDLAKDNAIENTDYLIPPVTTKEDEEAFPLEIAKQEKLAEIKTAKKAFQNTPIKSNIGSKEHTFYAGVDNTKNYSSVIPLCPEKGEIEIRVMEGLVKIGLNDLKVAVGQLMGQAYQGWLRENKLLESIYMAPDLETLEKIKW